ncbi:MAG TPA: hypothetical protein VFU97_15955 [Xanthobacteraceae bacterium]|nr:hypothetical protein [Xanthobacteraceae bacterium]
MSILSKAAIAAGVVTTAMAVAAGPALAGPLPTNLAALKAASATDVVQARWGGGWGRGGWGWGRGGWGWGHRGWGWGAGAFVGGLALGAALGGWGYGYSPYYDYGGYYPGYVPAYAYGAYYGGPYAAYYGGGYYGRPYWRRGYASNWVYRRWGW